MHLIVANQRLKCSHSITYYPEPEFSNFTTIRVGDSVLVTIEVRLLLAHIQTLIGDKNK